MRKINFSHRLPIYQTLREILCKLYLNELIYLLPFSYYGAALIYIKKIVKMENIKRLLDIGCGPSRDMKLIRKFYHGYAVGLDVNRSAIMNAKKAKVHNDFIQADAAYLPFKNNVFDIAVAIEVIEHLKKQYGYSLLKELDRVAKHKVLTTPLGLVSVGDAGHVSIWYPDEFIKHGFSVRGHTPSIFCVVAFPLLLFKPIEPFTKGLVAVKC